MKTQIEQRLSSEEIRQLAQKYHTPGAIIKNEWHPEYKKECSKINRQVMEENLMKKYDASGKVNKKVRISTMPS